MSMTLARRISVVTGALAVAVGALVSPASADDVGPSVNFFQTPVPVVGGLLSNSSNTPSFAIKDGWTIYDPDGVCSASTQTYDGNSGTYRQIWSYAGGATRVTGKYQWNATVGRSDYLVASATDCLGNADGSNWDYIYPSMAQQGAASYSAGWSSATSTAWSGGSVMKSTKVGATANYRFSGKMVTVVSDKAPDRGSVSFAIDGRVIKTVSLTSASPINRVIVWNSPYLADGPHTLTAKVVSGRVDLDAFIAQS